MKHDLTLKVRDSQFSTLKGVPTSNRCFVAREFGESSKAGTQMTGVMPGAPAGDIKWHTIHWNVAQCHVRRLQMRIAKAVKEGNHSKVKSLQWLLTHSFYAKLLAVKRVTSNSFAMKHLLEVGTPFRVENCESRTFRVKSYFILYSLRYKVTFAFSNFLLLPLHQSASRLTCHILHMAN